ncbi:helix-turn-helix transcriptional regulator [Gryllotalpicola ginsengisoli]|uniref:helix-turn-helix transcriptional regulator n=1 Tax=Gryllotalpicola ginsengisoli TaxID=444608 RepID=UPI0003B506CC|nr:PAS domain-containing protein [Gryllotalpicola ginsengisoli]
MSTAAAAAGITRLDRQTVDGERLLAVFTQLVEPIGRSLPACSEVVLHDLSRLPNSIVAIYGDVTGRTVGDPATDLLLKTTVSQQMDDVVGYETQLEDGRTLRSSTMLIRDVAGTPVAALCINSDISVWESVSRIAEIMLGHGTSAASAAGRAAPVLRPVDRSRSDDSAPSAAASTTSGPSEVFVRDVDELAALLLKQALDEAGVPPELMQKRHKIAVVRSLKARGMFLLRDAVETIAAALGVTRFTIYNYLNEIESEDEGASTAG